MLRLDRRSLRLQRAFDEPRIGAGVLAEREDARHSRFGGAALEPLIVRIVAIEERRAAGFEAEEDFGLGIGDGGDGGKEFEMHRLDRGDDGDVRAHQAGQRRDFARMVHADLEHGIARRLRRAAPATTARPSDC